MNPQFAIHLIVNALTAAFWICSPLLCVAFVAGIVINLVQIATSMQDSVFSTVPRLVACLVAFIFLLPWMIHHATAYATSVFGNLAAYAR